MVGDHAHCPKTRDASDLSRSRETRGHLVKLDRLLRWGNYYKFQSEKFIKKIFMHKYLVFAFSVIFLELSVIP